ncbi:Ribonuclease R winged-helix domain-containing protein [Dethiosulfatibacter aminovorans DSM 17477]|uniref:Ribonuclease R winged-helix domain-containing protein n=1 Tax=Dethiosulfatibacter aminovorans DSM 17477 TaxID=1121476 RepID=A0A1M6IX33_9FIRM|nr:FCD domain-containing protein [Dethiosulfatibacter aminovorans]SHJ39000.1 Ribonuclease R winged-helix domain-containing protein [Dethiosulfatibacter aminovorans DSM 17477]
MNLNEKKLRYEILSEMSQNRVPMGASMLALIIDTSQATIGRQLQQLEFEGYLMKHSNKGRTITEEGLEYLKGLKNDIESDKKAQALIAVSRDESEERLLDVLRTRKVIEKETIKCAVEKITDDEIEFLKSLINEQELKVLQGMLGEEEDYKFHCEIARICGNKVLEEILVLILSQRNSYSKFSIIRNRVKHTVINHKLILEAIEDRDTEKAEKLMVEHLEQTIKDVEDYFKENSSKKVK